MSQKKFTRRSALTKLGAASLATVGSSAALVSGSSGEAEIWGDVSATTWWGSEKYRFEFGREWEYDGDSVDTGLYHWDYHTNSNWSFVDNTLNADEAIQGDEFYSWSYIEVMSDSGEHRELYIQLYGDADGNGEVVDTTDREL